MKPDADEEQKIEIAPVSVDARMVQGRRVTKNPLEGYIKHGKFLIYANGRRNRSVSPYTTIPLGGVRKGKMK